MKLKIAQFGLGPIGIETVRLAAGKGWAEMVGAIDIDPQKIGQDLGRLTGLEKLAKRRVYRDLQGLLATARPDLIFHTAVSSFRSAFEQISPIAKEGISVVSSCEELIFPRLRQPQLARKLDRICKDHGARVVAAGVNPGFVMDLLPLCLTGVSRNIREIHIYRVVDAATRRESLQRKIGSGTPPGEFARLLKNGAAGHAGLQESLALIAHGLGTRILSVKQFGEPIIASRSIKTKYFAVRKGQTRGLHQRAEGKLDRNINLVLDLKMFLGAPAPQDAIVIVGDPPLQMVLPGGVAGDQATVASLVNTAPILLRAEPGLRLITDLPIPHWSSAQVGS